MAVYVRIELWPGGLRERAKLLQEIVIANDGTGDPTTGNYRVDVSHSTTYRGNGFSNPMRRLASEIWRSGTVTGFDRSRSPTELVHAALNAVMPKRGRDRQPESGGSAPVTLPARKR